MVQTRDLLLAITAGLTLLAGLLLGFSSLVGPEAGSSSRWGRTPALGQVQSRVSSLARAGRFGEAEAEVEAYLRHDHDNPMALLMLAELSLNRPTPGPERALERLKRVRSADPRLAAQARLDQGKAFYHLGRYDEAEASWLEALRLHPTIAEAGWALLDLYYVQGRNADAHQLALKLFEVEPDPRDRAHLLLELVRQDAEPSAPASIVQWFEPVVRKNPNDLHTSLSLGLALVRDSRPEEGLAYLRAAVAQHPNDGHAWDALLTGLAAANRNDELEQAVDGLPASLAEVPRFAKHRGRVAQDQRRWSHAAHWYRRAWDIDPHDYEVLYRLSRCLRLNGQVAEAELFEGRARSYERAREENRALYEEAAAIPTFGIGSHTPLYLRLADLRERMGRSDEAQAWRRIAKQCETGTPPDSGLSVSEDPPSP